MDQTEQLQPLTEALAEVLQSHYPQAGVFPVMDIPGEDHIFALDEKSQPMFDMLISTKRKFAFVWYYLHPEAGLDLLHAMKAVTLPTGADLAVKFPNISAPKRVGWPSIIRYGKHPAGQHLERFIMKMGNPGVDGAYYTAEDIRTYRNYDWYTQPDALKKVLAKAKQMVADRLGKNKDKLANIRHYYLYAGCAYHLTFPQLGFGMRDIDVEILFSPDWFTNTRAAYTRPCGIEEFGTPNYFNKQTRWLDLMYNSMHEESDDSRADLLRYMAVMRQRSDRWATMSQRPFIDLVTEQHVYIPNWIQRLQTKLEVLKVQPVARSNA